VTPAVTLLGPQRQPTVDRVISSLGLDGPVALVTAGWQERESDDAELVELVGGRADNLRLHARWMDVLECDPEYARAEREHRVALDEMRQLYLVQLDHALQAAYALAHRPGGHPGRAAMALEDALATIRLVDNTHLRRVGELQGAFRTAWPVGERDAVGRHREQVSAVLAGAACLVLAGGHVGELLHVLKLFDAAGCLPARLVAWSAGAMALTARVVLFHDQPAHGPAETEVYAAGLGALPGLVLLPHARRRLRTDDLQRMSILARRFAPDRCLVLDDGMRVDLAADGDLPAHARLVRPDGRIGEREAA
jgi:hypothetical protein